MIRRFAGAALFVIAGVLSIGAVHTAEQPSPAAHSEYLVQLKGPVLDVWKSALTANGAELLEYVPVFAFRARVSPSDAASIRRLPFVASVTPYDAVNKLSRTLARSGHRPYLVRLDRDADALSIQAALAGAGVQAAWRGRSLLMIAADGAQLNALARLPGIASIENFAPRIKHNEFGGGVILGSTLANANGFDGSSQIIGIADTGIGAGTAAGAHADIAPGRVSSLFNWPGVPDFCFETIFNDGAADVESGHGTHVATAALGAGNASGVGRGTAPGAALVFQALENYAVPSLLCALGYGLPEGYYLVGVPDDIGDLFQQAHTAGARIHSDSWGSEVAGEYTADSENADRFVWTHRDMTLTFSAGNSGVDVNGDGVVDEGSLNSPATAKNVISVGASENDRQSHWECDPALTYTTCAAQGGQNEIFTYGASWPDRYPVNPLRDDPSAGNADQMAAFSSRGPTSDGRIKPDVVAPGTWTLSGYSSRYQQQYDPSPNPSNGLYQYDGWGFPLDASYKYMGGTSMAAPLVAGGAAVVRDFYFKTLGHQASAALVKATLINSAVDLLDENNDNVFDNANPIPNSHEGWGRVDLANATDGSHQFDDETAPLSTGSNATFTFPITNPGQPFKVTLVWTDYPSSPAATINLVNDLDLTVVSPDGTTYTGNGFSGGWSITGTTADRRNNVENVYVFAAAAGTWTVNVYGYNIPQGPQPFALVMDAVPGDGSALPRVRASVVDGTATEAGPTSGAIMLARSGDPVNALTVSYVVSGTATAGTDYTALPASVTIPAGASAVTLQVDPIDDFASEPVETIVLTLQASADYTIGSPSSARVTLTSDDLPPDLSVSAITVPATAAAGLALTVTDTTRNQGTAPAPPSETGFYLSINTSWDSGDVFLGSRTVSALAIGATELAMSAVAIPEVIVPGTYYVIAKADWRDDIAETKETNNVRASAALRIGPDLIVSALTAPATAASGDPILVTETTKNQGAAPAAASNTAFYLSTNNSWDAADVFIGARAVSALASAAIEASSNTLVVPASTPVGSYYVIARADGDAGVAESLETNNTKASAVIKIGADLTITAVTAPGEAGAGDTVMVSVTTKNIGGGDAPPSTTAIFLSINTVLDQSDTFLGAIPAPALASGAVDVATAALTIPSTTVAGAYRILAIADGPEEITETNEINNNRVGGSVQIGPDLVVSILTAPATTGAGETIAVIDTSANQGGGGAAASRTEFYLSANGAWDATDIPLGSRAVPILAANATDVVSTPLTIPAGTATGSWYIVARADVDAAVAESLETNNVKASGVVKIGPDLTVSALTGPSTAIRGATIAVTATTRNAGGGSAPPSTTSFYLSTNTTLDAADVLLGSRAVAALSANASDSGPTSLTIPATIATGSYYVIAKSDAAGAIAETLETNNGRTLSLRINP